MPEKIWGWGRSLFLCTNSNIQVGHIVCCRIGFFLGLQAWSIWELLNLSHLNFWKIYVSDGVLDCKKLKQALGKNAVISTQLFFFSLQKQLSSWKVVLPLPSDKSVLSFILEGSRPIVWTGWKDLVMYYVCDYCLKDGGFFALCRVLLLACDYFGKVVISQVIVSSHTIIFLSLCVLLAH